MDWFFLQDRKRVSIGDVAKRLVIEEGILTEHHPLYYERLFYWRDRIKRAISAKNPQLSEEMTRRNSDTLFQFFGMDEFDFVAWYESERTKKNNKRTNHNSAVGKRTRQDRLKIAMEKGLAALQEKLKREPTANELFDHLTESDETGAVVDYTDDKLVWEDGSRNEHDVSRAVFASRLSRLRGRHS